MSNQQIKPLIKGWCKCDKAPIGKRDDLVEDELTSFVEDYTTLLPEQRPHGCDKITYFTQWYICTTCNGREILSWEIFGDRS